MNENKRLESENSQLRKLVASLRENRKTTTVEPPKVAERDIRQCFTRMGTAQAVVDFCNKHNITLPKDEYWYCINANGRTARIQGLESSVKAHGIPRITNGIVVWMELGNGELFLGHRDWLKYDRRTADLQKEREKQTQKQKDDHMAKLDPRILALL
jgi:hypothetical protein